MGHGNGARNGILAGSRITGARRGCQGGHVTKYSTVGCSGAAGLRKGKSSCLARIICHQEQVELAGCCTGDINNFRCRCRIAAIHNVAGVIAAAHS